MRLFVEHNGELSTFFKGQIASVAFEDVGHSDDARNLMKDYHIGELADVSVIILPCLNWGSVGRYLGGGVLVLLFVLANGLSDWKAPARPRVASATIFGGRPQHLWDPGVQKYFSEGVHPYPHPQKKIFTTWYYLWYSSLNFGDLTWCLKTTMNIQIGVLSSVILSVFWGSLVAWHKITL